MSKGGESTSTTEIPDFLREASELAINLAKKQGSIGYVPYQGPTVAALMPQQMAAMKNVSQAADAFGMAGGSIGAGAGMPKAQNFAGGMRGYSPFDMFMEAWGNVPKGQRRGIEATRKMGR